MENFDNLNNLIKLYGYFNTLFTEKQREYFEMYYFSDYSLNEIASIKNVSKNAVHDSINKVKTKLFEIENNVGILKEKDLLEKLKKENEELKKIISGEANVK